MAAEEQVRAYLACWFQLNRSLVIHPQGQTFCPQPVISGSHYSQAFETVWHIIKSKQGQDCYLEGTNQTLNELMTGTWDFIPCARCTLPIPVPQAQQQTWDCPCAEILSWPNLELPLPRPPQNGQENLDQICLRVLRASSRYAERMEDEDEPPGCILCGVKREELVLNQS